MTDDDNVIDAELVELVEAPKLPAVVEQQPWNDEGLEDYRVTRSNGRTYEAKPPLASLSTRSLLPAMTPHLLSHCVGVWLKARRSNHHGGRHQLGLPRACMSTTSSQLAAR